MTLQIALDSFKTFSAKLPTMSGDLAPEAADYARGRLLEGLTALPNILQLAPADQLADGPLGILETTALISSTAIQRDAIYGWAEEIGLEREVLDALVSRFVSDGWPKALKLAFSKEELPELVLAMHRTIAKIRFREEW